MPNLETVNELADTIADWCGIYGTCKSDGETGCELVDEKPFCCRMGFLDAMSRRIEMAVKNDAFLATRLDAEQIEVKDDTTT